MNPLRGGVVALAGLVGVGVLAWPSVASPSDDGYLKRDEQDTDLVLVTDDDDDTDPTNTQNTRHTAVTRDNTVDDTVDNTVDDPTRASRDQTTRGR